MNDARLERLLFARGRLDAILASIVVAAVMLYGGTTIAADYSEHLARLNPDPTFVTPSRPDPQPEPAEEPFSPPPVTSVTPEMAEKPPYVFDHAAAAAVLASVDVQRCKRDGGPTGSGHVNVTYTDAGTVAWVVVDSGPFEGSDAACIAARFRRTRVPPVWGGAPFVMVGKSFTIH
jgi:hypothetical protein